MHISVHIDSNQIHTRLQYVLDFLSNHPIAPSKITFSINKKNADKIISYGNRSEKGYFIPHQNAFFQRDLIDSKSWRANEYLLDNLILFSVEKHVKEVSTFFENNSFGFDLFETIFFHISRYEEYYCPSEKLDEHEMMWEYHQFLVKEGIYKNPVVDHIVFAFYKALSLHPKLLISQYSLSHDIDVLEKFNGAYRSLRALGNRLKKPNKTSGFNDWLSLYVKSKMDRSNDPFKNFEKLFIDKSMKILKDKTVYLMSGGASKHDNFYKLNDKGIDEIIKLSKERDYQIGLHSSYLSFDNTEMFKKEKEKLEIKIGKEVNKSRQHFLHFSFQSTPQIIEENNIHQDSTLGYQRLYGFRCGTGHPFYLYDFKNEKAFKFLEKPMIVMDGAWLSESNNEIAKADKEIKKFCQQNQYHTQISFNFHNTIFDPLKTDENLLWNWYESFFLSKQ